MRRLLKTYFINNQIDTFFFYTKYYYSRVWNKFYRMDWGYLLWKFWV